MGKGALDLIDFLLGSFKSLKKPWSLVAKGSSKVANPVGGTKAGQAIKQSVGNTWDKAKNTVKKGYRSLDDSELLKMAIEEAIDYGAGRLEGEEGNEGSDVLRTLIRADAIRHGIRAARKGYFNHKVLPGDKKAIRTKWEQEAKTNNPNEFAKMSQEEKDRAFRDSILKQANYDWGATMLASGLGVGAAKIVQNDLDDQTHQVYYTPDQMKTRLSNNRAKFDDDAIRAALIADYANTGRELLDSSLSRNIAKWTSDAHILPPLLRKRNRKGEIYKEDTPDMTFAQHIATLTSEKPHFATGVSIDIGKYTDDQADLLDGILSKLTPDQVNYLGNSLKNDNPEAYKKFYDNGYFQ